MRKMAIVISSHNAAAAEKVMKKVKESLGLKKGARVLKQNGFKACFVSNLVQKHADGLTSLDKYKDMDMLVFQSLPEGVQAVPGLFALKVHVNNDLGFSVYISAIPKEKPLQDFDAIAADVCDVIRGNLGL